MMLIRPIIDPIIDRLRQFRDSTRGSVSVEFALAFPLLMWAYASTYVFFDAYRQQSINLKAAYTVGDIISRETQPLNDAYIDGLYSMTQALIRTDSPLALRISVLRFDAEDDRLYLDWSETRGAADAFTNDTLGNLKERLPQMPDEERIILVESWNTWSPPFRVGLFQTDLENFIFTRPRFAPQVLFES